ncbi:MAG: hypothetical protein M5U28_35850 [Sandaracinaceae bacterium]|nr:hypothetical protein [Sandaracinaceae bacterium]
MTTREEEEEEPQQSPVDPHELEGQSYHHLGVFARGIFAPQFIQNLFVAGGTNGLNVGLGAFYNYRRDGLNIIAEVWWAGFYAAGPFRGLNETDFETEWVESELSVVFGSLALMWSIPLTSWLAFEIGFGLGFGGVFGGLYRTEAPPAADGWEACTGEGNPDPAYCDASTSNGGEGSYQRVENSPEPYNSSGGVPRSGSGSISRASRSASSRSGSCRSAWRAASPPTRSTRAARSRSASEASA